MRGKPPAAAINIKGIRITPADAGKTLKLALRFVRIEDHPRGCGENLVTDFTPATGVGSPPRMRGKHNAHMVGMKAIRITPADAGKTRSRKARRLSA